MPWGTLHVHMNRSLTALSTTVTFFVVCALLAGCASAPVEKPRLQRENLQAVDFSGSWEMDYSLSDSTQDKLDVMARDLNRQAQRRAQSEGRRRPAGAEMMVRNSAGPNSGSSVLGLARMADLITQSPLLEIDQDTHKISVKREEDFSLTCEFYPGEMHKVETPFGTEICGWNGHQLVFELRLPEGLSIQHIITMGAAGQKLLIATTVVSSQVSFPFSLNRVYNRFEPGESGFQCQETLTRGRVCTTESR